LIGKFGTFTNSVINIGVSMVLFMGAFLPKDTEDWEADEKWRIIYGCPIIFAIFTCCFFTFIFKSEPITYCIRNNRDAEALTFIKMLYKPNENGENEGEFERFLAFSRANSSVDASSVSFYGAVCGKKYRKATWIGFWLMIFN